MNEITVIASRNINVFNNYSSENIFGYHVNSSNGQLISDSGGFYSHKIPVIPGEIYYVYSSGGYGCRFITCYNSSQVFMSGGASIAISFGGSYTIPQNCYYIVISSYAAFKDALVISKKQITEFVPYGSYLSRDKFIYEFDRTPMYGKSLITYGDSITSQGIWQRVITRMLGVNHTAYGLGGSKISGASGDTTAMCQSTRINALPDSADIVLVMGGTNDWAQSIAIGSFSDTDPETSFYAAMKKICTDLYAKYKNKKLIFMTPIWGEKISTYAGLGWANAYTNLQGKTPRDYGKAMIDVCGVYGIPVFDIGATCRIGPQNITTMLKDDGDRIHPNEPGGQNIGNAVIRNLMQFKYDGTLM